MIVGYAGVDCSDGYALTIEEDFAYCSDSEAEQIPVSL